MPASHFETPLVRLLNVRRASDCPMSNQAAPQTETFQNAGQGIGV